MDKQSLSFSQTLFIGRPAEDVWVALTDKKYVDQYYLVPLGNEKINKGDDIYYGDEDDKMISGTVLELEESNIFMHSFKFLQGEGDEAETFVKYTLEPLGDMCILHLTHGGFEEETQTYHDICGGWPIILSGLKTLLETGETLPWPEPEDE